MAEMKEKKLKKASKATKRVVEQAKIYISASFNNTLVTVVDLTGNTLTWASSGNVGFKGTRKATPFAATSAVDKAIKKAKEEFGVKDVEIYVKGPGAGRDAALRSIRAAGVNISLIADVTPTPHNGPRPKKKRRA